MMTIDGNYEQISGGILEIEIGGLASQSEYDVLMVTGNTNLGGTIRLKFIDGFSPQQGDTFEFLTTVGTADLTGATYEVANLADGFEFEIATLGDGIQMLALIDGVFVPSLDFSEDGIVDVIDIDLLLEEIVAKTDHASFDLDGDGTVNDSDLTKWLSDAANHNGFSEAYLLGDSNLDGVVNSEDLNRLGISWQQNIALWSGGDFTTDGRVNSADLNELGVNWQASIPLAAAQSVPEPSGILLLCVAGLLAVASRSRTRRTGDVLEHE